MLRSCSVCGRVHDPRRMCRLRTDGHRDADIKRFRSSAEWQNVRVQALDRDGWLCRWCLKDGRITSDGLSVHHIVPLAEDFSSRGEVGNLVTLCARCHEDAEAGAIPRAALLGVIAEPLGIPPAAGNSWGDAFS